MEDTTLLNLPYWKPLSHNISWSDALKICPKPWCYHTAEELNHGPIKGSFNTYEGGGYHAVLGYNVDGISRLKQDSRPPMGRSPNSNSLFGIHSVQY